MTKARALTRSELRNFPLPAVEEGDKYAHGRLLVLAGSRPVPGSAYLSAMAALRSGAGKVHVATVKSVSTGLALQLPEVLVVALAENRDGGCSKACLPQVVELVDNADAIVAGPGMAEGAVVSSIAKAMLASKARLVLDAAVLRALAPAAAHCRKAGQPPILLPHSGEMAALLNCSEEEVDADRPAAALKAARHYGAAVLSKGTTSHIACPEGDLWTFNGGVAGLGVSGSGDTLAGIVGGFLARGAEPLTALLWGVLLHGEAGQELSKKIGPVGFLAREIPDEVPALLAR